VANYIEYQDQNGQRHIIPGPDQIDKYLLGQLVDALWPEVPEVTDGNNVLARINGQTLSFDSYPGAAELNIDGTDHHIGLPMTSPTAPAPNVASASSTVAGSSPHNAFNMIGTTSAGANLSLNWQSASGRFVSSSGVSNDPNGEWLQRFFGTAYVAKSYIIRRRTDLTTTPRNQFPRTWFIEGSNDASSWDTLHTVTNGPVPGTVAASRYQAFSFSMQDNNTAYSYYRLRITRIQGGDTACGIGELEFFDANSVILPNIPIDSNNVCRYLVISDSVNPAQATNTYQADV